MRDDRHVEMRARHGGVIVAALIAGALAAVAILALGAQLLGPQRVVVSVVAAEPVVLEMGAALPGPVELLSADDARDAEHQVRSGRSIGVLVVDPSDAQDRLMIDDRRSPAFIDAVAGVVQDADGRFGRTVAVEPMGLGGVPLRVSQRLTISTLLLGFLIAAAPSLRRRHMFAREAIAAGRVALTAAAGLLAAVVVCLLQGTTQWAAVTLVVVGTIGVACTVLLFEALLGVTGLAVAAAVLGVLFAPLVVAPDPVFLPTWLQGIWPWLPPGATYTGLAQILSFGGSGLGALLILSGWLLVTSLFIFAMRQYPPGYRHIHAAARRLRILAVLTVTGFTVLTTSFVVSSTAAESLPPIDITAVNQLSKCTRIPRVKTVADLNRIARLPSTADFAGADVGVDADLQDGRRMWLFADTIRGAGGIQRNSMLISDGRCLRSVRNADRRAPIPNRPGTQIGYWPMSVGVVSRAGYDLVAVGAQRVHSTGIGSFSFETLGPSVAVFLVPRGGVPQLVAVRDLSPDNPDPASPMWGAAVAVAGERVYVYGTARSPATGALGFSVHVARVPIDQLLDTSAWRYWDGAGWSVYPQSAVAVIGAYNGTSQTFSVFRRQGAWYALSKENEFLGRNVRVWLAPDPWGPFTPSAVVADLPSDAATGKLIYMPLAHPRLLPERGSMVISYSRNDVDFEDILERPERYRPRFMRVDLPQPWY